MQIPDRSDSGSSRNREAMNADLWSGGRLNTPESSDSCVGVDDFETWPSAGSMSMVESLSDRLLVSSEPPE
jgi:hypothetical protein